MNRPNSCTIGFKGVSSSSGRPGTPKSLTLNHMTSAPENIKEAGSLDNQARARGGSVVCTDRGWTEYHHSSSSSFITIMIIHVPPPPPATTTTTTTMITSMTIAVITILTTVTTIIRNIYYYHYLYQYLYCSLYSITMLLF